MVKSSIIILKPVGCKESASTMTFDFDPIFTLLFNTETIRPMSIKIKVSLPLGIEEKQQVLR
jgi:hypothetical protein